MSNSLKRLLLQDDVIIFVGSGISRWSGLPSWGGLIDELADYLDQRDVSAALVRQEAAAGDLLQAASYGFLKLTPPQVAAFMRQACRTGAAVPGPIHQAIMKLGPTCFITTNYDDLLEQAYRQIQPAPSEPHVVLNTQLLEQAEIIHAQARKFIFKPHGDARSVESIVLTREQYRMLLPEGRLSATLNTFKTLLQSRPVLFIGFGLRDPDFLYLRDILANIYRGGMRDHYAIVADPVADQADYWRTHYGIHLIGYPTADSGRDHTALLTLLQSLGIDQGAVQSAPCFDATDPAAVLALARYAASCLLPIAGDRFDIRVNAENRGEVTSAFADTYSYWSVERLLAEGPNRLILLGEPGAGKSFAIREAVNNSAASLQDACLRGELTHTMCVPIMLDLKLYEGDLEGQIRAKFPEALELERLRDGFPIGLYLDGYNEMPRIYREDGTFDQQLDALLHTFPGIGLTIGSRTSDGLERLELPLYRLSQISKAEVERRLHVAGISLPRAHYDDIVSILQRPFYFRLLDSSDVSLERVSSPKDLYAQFIWGVRTRFEQAVGPGIDLVAALQRHAYACLQEGSEAFALSDLVQAISAVAPQIDPTRIDEIANWLASADLIIPMRGGRAAFVHQSITEFLAACELAARLKQRTGSAAELITLRRWDNAIFLTLGLLADADAAALLTEITTADVSFAFNAARFVEHGSEVLIGRLLDVVAKVPNAEFDHDAIHAFERLPFARSHEPVLRRILGSLPSVRGEAFIALAKALGKSVKDELIDRLFDTDVSGPIYQIGDALSRVVEPHDLRPLIDRLLTLDPTALDGESSATDQRVIALSKAVSGFPPEHIRLETMARLSELDGGQQQIVAALICDLYYHSKSTEGLAMIIEAARARIPYSLFAIYLNVKYESDLKDYFISALDDNLFETILYYIDHGDHWSVQLLKTCGHWSGVRERLLIAVEEATGIRQCILAHCATQDDSALFAALQSWLSGDARAEEQKLLKMVDFPELDWSSRHDLLVALLARHDLDIAQLVLGGTNPPQLHGLDTIDLGDIEPWLDWLLELIGQQDGDRAHQAYWIKNQLAVLIARSSGPNTKAQLFAVLDNGAPNKRWAVASTILPKMEGVLLSDLSPAAIELLKSILVNWNGHSEFQPHPFAKIADEAFVYRELFPLASKDEKTRDTVAAIARHVGKRLGIRLNLPARGSKIAENSSATSSWSAADGRPHASV